MDALKLLKKTSFNNLQDAADKMSMEERDALARELQELSAIATFFGTYLSRRSSIGVDSGHKDAAKTANERYKFVRRINGYHITPTVNI